MFMILPLGSSAKAAGGELKIGRYVGFLKQDDTGEKVALIVNTFIVQPEDFTQFPVLNATFKMSLGGYGTAEYITETFEDVKYDFNNGLLSLDEQANDLVISAEVNEDGLNTRVTGQVWIRSAAKAGILYLEYENDEPGSDSDGDDGSAGTFVPLLRGQYEGWCGSERAAMQITAGKGLLENGPERRGLHDYAIVARLAFDKPDVCSSGGASGGPAWCVTRAFHSGTYNFFTNRLNLDSENGSTSCSLEKGRLQCQIRMLDQSVSCDLLHTNMVPKPYQLFGRSFGVRTTSEQRQPLPEPAPPQHAALVQALRGQFVGYLHNEANNRYQPFKLNVIPSVSTVNPHDENRVFVSATAVTYFGRGLTGEFWSQQLEKRAFYLRPGFTLESPETDGFLQVEDWRNGYIRGVWISHAYGRIGTVQMIKGNTIPPLDDAAPIVGTVAGEFEVAPAGGLSTLKWWFKTLFPPQPLGRDQGTFTFEGDSRLSGGITRPIRIVKGSYDVYSSSFSWITAESPPRMVLGEVSDNGDLRVFWPGAPVWGVRMADYAYDSLQRISN